MTELVGRTTRGAFRDLMTDSTVGDQHRVPGRGLRARP
jgi:hypothetical protein